MYFLKIKQEETQGVWGKMWFPKGGPGKVSERRGHLKQYLKVVKGDLHDLGKSHSAEEGAGEKAPRQEKGLHVQGIARQSEWVESYRKKVREVMRARW